VRLVLTGSGKDSVFFKSRSLSPSELFPGAKQAVGTEARPTFSVGDPGPWTEAHIMGLYGAVPVVASLPASAVETPAEGAGVLHNAG